MPTLDPPALDRGDDMSSRYERLPRWRPVPLAVVTFVLAMAATVLVIRLAGAIGN